METPHHEHSKSKRGERDYLPLIVIVLVVALSASAGQWAHGTWDGRLFMRQFSWAFF